MERFSTVKALVGWLPPGWKEKKEGGEEKLDENKDGGLLNGDIVKAAKSRKGKERGGVGGAE